MDVSKIVVSDGINLKNCTFNHVTGLNKFLDGVYDNRDLAVKHATFINIDESLDSWITTYSYSSATFKDMDMSGVKVSDPSYQHFINVTNLNLIGKDSKYATFENVNGATGDDCSKIPGHPDFTGDITKYQTT